MHHKEPLYKIPSFSTFSKTIIPELCSDTAKAMKEQMCADIEECAQSISFTSDMWTSRAKECYISLTCHCLTFGFEVRAYALANQLVTESHTASNIPKHLQTMMDDWELPLQRVPIYVATDIAENFCGVLTSFPCISMQCIGHTLQLAIKDAKEETAGVPSILKKCRAIVGYYKHSAETTTRLQDFQHEAPPSKLVQDVETRYSSECDALSRLLQLQEAVCLELATSETMVPNPTPQEWKMGAGLVKVPRANCIGDQISECPKYSASSSVISFLYGTQVVLKNCIAADDDTSKFAKKPAEKHAQRAKNSEDT
ncbi:hypothetical protein HPB47_002249 [Ixodes persulcatus]|uniref:Uncharacterized protein n=1 Tax=Ixodes persulcatus TaxID=34615 RepID=A0AC60PLS8_IXOPE|nr:hypothetical protein HPB47_002249 [Ixodes persulcatus]